LAAVTVEGEEIYAAGKLREFYERAQTGFGHFVTRSQIEERSARVASDLLYGIPGLQVTPSAFGGNTVRLSRVTTGCRSPVVFVDGVKIYGADLDGALNPEDIAGIEVYTRASNVPQVFNLQGAAACGVIAIWTR
jgi:outer membrane cobalamin receptor